MRVSSITTGYLFVLDKTVLSQREAPIDENNFGVMHYSILGPHVIGSVNDYYVTQYYIL